MWIIFSLLAALAAASVVTLTKVGLKNVDSSLAFAVESVLIVAVAWGVAAWQGQLSDLGRVEGRTWGVLVAAGVLTAVSSLLSFRALSLGNASQVSPLDKVSLVLAIVLAVVFLKEKVSWQVWLGAGLMTVGAVLIAAAKPAAGE